MTDIRMWSYYAAGHTGCTIEVDLDESPDIFEVTYARDLQKFTQRVTKETKAVDILSFKTNHWEYEKEYRIITENDFYSISGKITGVFFWDQN